MRGTIASYLLIVLVLGLAGSAKAQVTYQGDYNTFYGMNAGDNTTGDNDWDTFIGAHAGSYNTTGDSNTFLGFQAGFNNTTGGSNTFVGMYSGVDNTTGSGNVFLGYSVGLNKTGSNKLYIDNSDTTSPLIYGQFDNAIVRINGRLGILRSPGASFSLM